jgi:hypothetical protein
MIIHDIDMTRRFVVEFLRISKRHWCVRKQIRLGVTLVDLMFIEKSKENKVVEQHFVEA